MMKQELWFPQPIWFEDHDLNFDTAIAFCKKLQAESEGRKISNRGGWQSNDIDLFAHEELSEIAKIVKAKADFLATQLNKKAFNVLKCTNAWVNINRKHDYNLKHSHPGGVFSGCIYLKVPENSGDLVFYRPDMQPFFPVPENIYSPIFFSQTTYSPRAGFIIIFPSWLEHEVSMSNADEDRISIAFNMECI